MIAISVLIFLAPSTLAFAPTRIGMRSSHFTQVFAQADGDSRTVEIDLSPLELSEENVMRALEECKETVGTMFGNNEDNLKVGITGDVELVELDGPTVIIGLKVMLVFLS
jgi:hypothetical protein